jgi:hypothetical protein
MSFYIFLPRLESRKRTIWLSVYVFWNTRVFCQILTTEMFLILFLSFWICVLKYKSILPNTPKTKAIYVFNCLCFHLSMCFEIQEYSAKYKRPICFLFSIFSSVYLYSWLYYNLSMCMSVLKSKKIEKRKNFVVYLSVCWIVCLSICLTV